MFAYKLESRRICLGYWLAIYIYHNPSTSNHWFQSTPIFGEPIFEDEKPEIFQPLENFEKNSFILNISSEDLYGQYDKIWLERLLLEDFISCYWIRWINIVTKVGKFKFVHQYQGCILKINLKENKDCLGGYKQTKFEDEFSPPWREWWRVRNWRNHN